VRAYDRFENVAAAKTTFKSVGQSLSPAENK
jgi:hypothetical protein